MARGRPKTPTALKVVRGTDRADRNNPNEIKPSTDKPPRAPHFLSKYGRSEWERIAKEMHALGILSRLDRGALTAYCEAWALYRSAHELYQTQAAADPLYGALIVKTAIGNEIQNPLIGIMNKARADVVRFAAEFGMTPAARSRVNGLDNGKKIDQGEGYFN